MSETPTLRVAPDGAVPLDGGGWVLFRDPAAIRQRDRKELVKKIDAMSATDGELGNGQFGFMLSTVYATLALAIVDWSYEFPTPMADISSLDELEIPQYDELAKLIEPFRARLFPMSAQPSAKPDDSPTGPSSA